MSTNCNIITTPINGDFSNGLQRAFEAVQKLEEAGCRIVHMTVNARRACLVVVAPPAFVKGACKSRFANPGGGFTRVMATRYFGVQLEWFVHCDEAQAVAHG